MSSEIKDWCVLQVYRRRLDSYNDVVRYEAANVFNTPLHKRVGVEYLTKDEAEAMAKFLNFIEESNERNNSTPR
jgi:hypothetical protein